MFLHIIQTFRDLPALENTPGAMKQCAAPYRAGTPYPRAIAVAAKTMRTTSNAWTKLIRAKPLAARDRKSTRLNSSHLVISYAVFCLKKKNNQITTDKIAIVAFHLLVALLLDHGRDQDFHFMHTHKALYFTILMPSSPTCR